MHDPEAQKSKAETLLLEENIGKIIARLHDCRKENELLRSEIVSLQNILRSCKLPGSENSAAGDLDNGSGGGFSYAEKLQVRQKLVQILQRIEMELRSGQTL
ncbi:MAG: hypothetical protein HGA72_06865 [Chlorobiaceae bacterium]|nr:hypothetical protein [Chlorobiaceae bacterium]NTW63207.1 hypothetical protein [Chlorobiaceae bacterium]